MNKAEELWITILDYAVGDIRMYHLTDVPTDSEGYVDIDIERWLYDNDANYKESTCYYMCSLEKPETECKEVKYHD